MRSRVVTLAAVASLVAAQGARLLARDEAAAAGVTEPYTPSPASAPFVSLGYREVVADLLFFRLVGYFGGKHTADGVASLVEAIAALDPHYRKIYLWGARAMTHALGAGVEREHFLRAIRLLETGMTHFPDDYQLPELAGEIYAVDLQTTDPAERKQWDAAAARWFEIAVRKPGAPASIATFAAFLRTKLGQKQRAADSLRELLLITDDTGARAKILEKLAELESGDSAEIAAEVFEERRRFQTEWRRDRPYMPASLYILIGPRSRPGFDPADLATGGINLIGSDLDERLEPPPP